MVDSSAVVEGSVVVSVVDSAVVASVVASVVGSVVGAVVGAAVVGAYVGGTYAVVGVGVYELGNTGEYVGDTFGRVTGTYAVVVGGTYAVVLVAEDSVEFESSSFLPVVLAMVVGEVGVCDDCCGSREVGRVASDASGAVFSSASVSFSPF